MLQVQHNFKEKFRTQTFQMILWLFILYFRPETGFGCSSQPESFDVNVLLCFMSETCINQEKVREEN